MEKNKEKKKRTMTGIFRSECVSVLKNYGWQTSRERPVADKTFRQRNRRPWKQPQCTPHRSNGNDLRYSEHTCVCEGGVLSWPETNTAIIFTKMCCLASKTTRTLHAFLQSALILPPLPPVMCRRDLNVNLPAHRG